MYRCTVLNLSIRWSLVVTFTFRLLNPGEKSLGTNAVWGQVSPRPYIDAVKTRIISYPCQESNNDSKGVNSTVQSLH